MTTLGLNAYISHEGDVLGGDFIATEALDYPHLLFKAWSTALTIADIDLEWRRTYTRDSSSDGIALLDGSAAHISIRDEEVRVHVAAHTPGDAAAAMEQLRDLIPVGNSAQDDEVPFNFWSYGPNGPERKLRNLKTQTWEQIAENYPAHCRLSLTDLLGDFTPGRGGQLLLWHGSPGTGKTNAIRALSREWAGWCEMHYIADPDMFFGNHADYMLHVLLADANPDKWRLLLLEDAGELLAPDARKETGQGLSRFLNAVDGLIGQGLQLLILVTTNEELRKLHPAVARPGRCASEIEFQTFNPSQAQEWLENHGHTESVPREQTLAELFAKVEGFYVPKIKAVGF